MILIIKDHMICDYGQYIWLCQLNAHCNSYFSHLWIYLSFLINHWIDSNTEWVVEYSLLISCSL